jgi:hypothetical protein
MAMISERVSVATQLSAVETIPHRQGRRAKTGNKLPTVILAETAITIPTTAAFCLPAPTKRIFSESDLDLSLLQNSAILDMMRNPPADESGFGVQ